MQLEIKDVKVPLRIDEDGVIRVGPTRVTLSVMLSRYIRGSTPEQIVQDFDTLKLPDVYAVIAYYLQNQVQVDEFLKWKKERADELQRTIESQPKYQEWRRRIQAYQSTIQQTS